MDILADVIIAILLFAFAVTLSFAMTFVGRIARVYLTFAEWYVLLPIDSLIERVKDSFNSTVNRIPIFNEKSEINQKLAPIGGTRLLFLGLISLVGFAVGCIYSFLTDGYSTLVSWLLDYTTFGAIYNLIKNPAEVTFPLLLAVGFSSILISICMQNTGRINKVALFVYSLIFTCCFSMVASYAHILFEFFTSSLVKLFMSLKSMFASDGTDFFKVVKFIGFGILFILLVYLFILLILYALKEYMNQFFFSSILVLCTATAIGLLQHHFDLPEYVYAIISVVAVSGVELLRFTMEAKDIY